MGVVKPDAVAQHAGSVLLRFQAMPMDTLFLQRPDHAFNHPVLLRAVRRDELLVQTVAADHAREAPAGKYQSVIAA